MSSFGLLIAALVMFGLKVCHDQREYKRAWQAERRQFERYVQTYDKAGR